MIKKGIFALLSLVLCAVLVVSLFNIIKIATDNTKPEENSFTSRVIERNGVKFYPKQDITTLLLIGLDRTGPVTESDNYLNSARADVVMLISFDNTQKTIRVLNLNRDSMIPVQVLGVNGFPAGKSEQQLALAHTYGKGLKDSAENVVTTVSEYLYNLKIDYYASVGMDCIELINDSLGGVEVNVEEDFSAVTPTIPLGKVKLTGAQAVSYIRHRKTIGDGLNATRMVRQEKYFVGLLDAIKSNHKSDKTKLMSLYEDLSDRMVTNSSIQTFADMLDMFSEYTLDTISTPKGENKIGKEFNEFYVDSADLDRIVLDFFYSEK